MMLDVVCVYRILLFCGEFILRNRVRKCWNDNIEDSVEYGKSLMYTKNDVQLFF